MSELRAVAIVLAAGSGRRLGAEEPKAFLEIGGRSMLALAASAAAACPSVEALVAAVVPGSEERARALLEGLAVPAEVVTGGPTRGASVVAALDALPGWAEAVACHDAARPFATTSLFDDVLDALEGVHGAIPVVPVPDTVKRVEGGLVVATEDRERLVLAQTPQAFLTEPLRDAHQRASRDGLSFTDDAAAMEWAGYRVRAIPGDPANVKITTARDLERARELVAGG
jgi:2-C-methyl-D-erythritol 4-phosphate cytidylyltransferase/2-C-methyl-D-erythritol 2,4-cyclodiphosphate synthase